MRRASRVPTVVRAALLVAVFLVLALPWLERGRTMLPGDDATSDTWLIFWVLDWVRHALATGPRTLFDPPINYPAPHQLTDSEHFLASQLLFAPLRWATNSAPLATNLTAMLSYGLAAACMDALLCALGVSGGASFVAALGYGFGWMIVPGCLRVLQIQHLFLPLAALAMHRLRERPTAWRALAFGAAFATGLLSSYHMAVYLTAGMAVWGTLELARRRPARGRFVAWTSVAAATAIGVLVAISLPYFERPEATGDLDLAYSRFQTSHLAGESPQTAARVLPASLVASTSAGCLLGAGLRTHCIPVDDLVAALLRDPTAGIGPVAVVIPALVLVGLVAAIGDRRCRRLCVVALALLLPWAVLGGSEYVRVGDVELPWRALVSGGPARFIRVPQRALVLAAFGGAFVVAAGAEVLLRRLGRARPVVVPVLAVALVVRWPPRPLPVAGSAIGPTAAVIERWGRLSPTAYLDNPALGADAASYLLVARLIATTGPAPVLDLPPTSDGTTVVGQTILRQPSVSFYTGYTPAHVSIVDRLIARLPEPDALDDLVDMTGLGWIVLRGAREWRSASARERFLQDLSRHARVRSKVTLGGLTVVRLDPTSHHPGWFASIAAGPRRGWSALGSPLAPLPAAAEQAIVELPDVVVRVPPGEPLVLHPTLRNRGAAAWAVAIPERPGRPFTVHLDVRCHAPDAGADACARTFELARDVPPGESLVEHVAFPAPLRPGRYRVEVAVTQVEGTDLRSSANPAFADVEVVDDAER